MGLRAVRLVEGVVAELDHRREAEKGGEREGTETRVRWLTVDVFLVLTAC